MEEQKEKKQPVIVLEFYEYVIEAETMNYILKHGSKSYFYPTVSGALAGMSDMILKDKFASKEYQAGQKDLDKLLSIIKNHHEWFVELCKGY
jgi:hypothetical protein